MTSQPSFTAFAGAEKVAHGDLVQVARVVNALLRAEEARPVLVFDDRTGHQVDIDLRDASPHALSRYAEPAAAPRPPAPPAPGSTESSRAAPQPTQSAPSTPSRPRKRGPGRPRLGVVGREVTLLPRHWEWLNAQPGGASVALRKLVEKARLGSRRSDEVRRSREAAYRFMAAIAGDAPGFEEASRALFAGRQEAFDTHTRDWSADVRNFVRSLATEAFDSGPGDA